MLLLKLGYAAINFGEPLGRLGVAPAAFNIPQSAGALDVGSAPRAVELKLPQIVVDHRFDQFVPCQHALAGRP